MFSLVNNHKNTGTFFGLLSGCSPPNNIVRSKVAVIQRLIQHSTIICPVCGMMHIKEPLLLIGKSNLCGGSRFPLSLSE